MEKSMPSMVDVLNALSDEKALDIFKIIALSNCDSNILITKTKLTLKQYYSKALSNCDSNILITKTKLTLKQYYSKMDSLIKAGLVRKKDGKYCLTSLGKVFYNLQITAENALSNYWKLKAIDSFDNLSKEEYHRFIDGLIDNYNVKKILTKVTSPSCYSTMNHELIQKTPFTNYHQQQQAKPSSFKIMLVDDEQDTLLTYKTFLLAAAEGYNVDAFTDSYEALKHFINLNHSYYDLVITDIRMPGLNGLQLYQKIKAIDNTINVLFVSALDALQEVASIFQNIDFRNVIRKPANQEDFLDKVKTALAA
jgi:CheY-like chemotaxis protein/predicted transcriptional regulator